MATDPSGPRALWATARAAINNGYDITVTPRGSSLALYARRDRDEAVARWRRTDLHAQGDGEGRWQLIGRPWASSGGGATGMDFGRPARMVRADPEGARRMNRWAKIMRFGFDWARTGHLPEGRP